MTEFTETLEFSGAEGRPVTARLDLPAGPPRAIAIFAHCFACAADTIATARISRAMAERGIAILRFDFTGLSHDDFPGRAFSATVADITAAARALAAQGRAPSILVGHSLGGSAVLAAAGDIPGIRAVATINAPADAAHVSRVVTGLGAETGADGARELRLAGHSVTIHPDFLEDLAAARLEARIAALRVPLLVLHAPRDAVVGIDNAAAIFGAAKHPKSFISLDDADHMLSRAEDADYAAGVLAAWAARYVTIPEATRPGNLVHVTETGRGRYQQLVEVHGHSLLADEPAAVGGEGSGPNPYDFLAIALGTCTAMTLRMYAEKKKLALGRVSVAVDHAKVHAEDCADCEGRTGRIDRFERVLTVEGALDAALAEKLVEIAGKCPVHRTLEQSSVVVTRLAETPPEES